MTEPSIVDSGLLADLGVDEAAAFLACGRETQFRPGTAVLRAGQRSATLYLVLRGTLHVERESGGKRVFLGEIASGGFFGEISLFDPGPVTADVRAVSEGTLIEIGQDGFRSFLAEHPATGARVLWKLVEEMARRLRRSDERLLDTIFWARALR